MEWWSEAVKRSELAPATPELAVECTLAGLAGSSLRSSARASTAGSAASASATAASSPVAGEGSHNEGGLLNLVTKGDGLRIWRVPLVDESVFLCAVGGPNDYPASTIDAIRRILLEHNAMSAPTKVEPRAS